MKKQTQDVYELVERIPARSGGMLTSAQPDALKTRLMQTTDMQMAPFQMVGRRLGGNE